MASFEEAINGLLTTREAFTRHVADRSYDSRLPQLRDPKSQLPAITWQVVDRPDEEHFLGVADTFPVEVQVDTWAADAAGRRVLAEVVRTEFRGWRGDWGGITIRRAFKRTDFNSETEIDNGGPLPVFRNTQRHVVWIRQAPVGVT